MEMAFQRVKLSKEQEGKRKLQEIISNPQTELLAKTKEAVNLVQEAGMSDLIHYVALRKVVLEMLKTLLCLREDEGYNKESDIHNIIFPRHSDSDTTSYQEHNLWILDEKLNFTEYISSDKAINKESKPDILIYNKRMAYRSGNEISNPITIFEFKRPQEENFINKSKDEDPIEQVVRYAKDIKGGKYKTPEGRDILVDVNTPVYGFIICDLTKAIKEWLYDVKDFTPLPDGLGFYKRHDSLRLYIEILAWDKVLKDAELRNMIFFKKLGLI